MKLSLLATVILTGCAGTLTQEEIEWRDGIDRENWRNCERVYQQQRIATIHIDHRHGPRDRVRAWDIRSDLHVNNCRAILGDYWADY